MNDSAIQVRGLSKRYRIGKSQNHGDDKKTKSQKVPSPFRYLIISIKEPSRDEIIWALKDVTFDVRYGEVLGIIGKNGSGKSTLLKILSRITEPTRGKALINGRVGSLLEVGTGFHPELTGRENIFLSGAILGMKRAEVDRKFDEIVAFAETEKFLDTPVKRYSSGMYVRLAFSVAAHLEPEILLIDEVLAVGDAAFQKKCLGKMSDVASKGRTVMFVSHNMVAVQNLCQRIIWLQEGTIVKEGPAQDVVSSYLATSYETKSEISWPDIDSSPGNENVRLRRVCVRPENGVSTDPISMDTPFLVEVEYWNLIPGSQLHVTLHFYTEQHAVAFSTFSLGSNHQNPTQSHKMELYRSICHVPGNLLNAGTYSILLLIVRNTDKIIFRHDGIVSFPVLDLSQRNTTWYGREPGAVHPKLDWHTEKIG